MSEVEALIRDLRLVGYEKLTDHGLALPVFGQSQDANVFYTARSTLPGEPNGQIAEFNQYDPDALVHLPPEQMRETVVGKPWLDIFLWDGTPYVGTAAEIWTALEAFHAGIAEHAPLSLLIVSEGVTNSAQSLELSRQAFSWLRKRYGESKAVLWRIGYFRKILLRGLRRELGTSIHEAEVRHALQEQIS